MQCCSHMCRIQLTLSKSPRMYVKKILFLGKKLFTTISNSQITNFNCRNTINNYSSMSSQDITRILQRRKRQKKRENTEKGPPSTVTLQILGSGVRGVPSVLYLSTDHTKYLFNCGEGTQRLAHEHHLRITKLEHVLFTTPTWKNTGGLPGMALTIQDAGVPQINLHGPKGMRDIFDATKRFVMLTNLSVNETNCDETSVYEDSCVTLRYVHLNKNDSESTSDTYEPFVDDDTDYYAHEYNGNSKRPALWQTPPPKRKLSVIIPTVDKVSGCIAYICKITDKAGTLNLMKCVDMGVEVGPMLAELKAGRDVTLDNGKIIKSTDVCDPPKPGPIFIVLECPSVDYLDSLMEHPTFFEYQKCDGINVPGFVVHFTPDNIIKHERYIEWMSRFAKTTQHIIINDSNNCVNYEALHRIQDQLHLLHPTIFPMLHDYVDDDEIGNKHEFPEFLNIHRAKTLNTIGLRPYEGLEASIDVKLNRQANINEVMAIDGFPDVCAALKTEIAARADFIRQSPAFPKIVMLGTGSCIPNKVRNTSGILLRIDEDTNVLMDCGEGTVGQIIRFFGRTEATKIIRDIKAIYISHLHADHHLGLLGVLLERRKFTEQPAFLLAPKQIESWLRLYHRKFEKIDDCYHLVPLQGLLLDARRLTADAESELKKSIRILDVNTVEVRHCLHAFAVAWTLASGEKVVYSGDTRPCQSIVTLGQDCDLLIHEATMEDGLEAEADRKMHSTLSQALAVGDEMNAKFVLLTHFSQRYSKMPRLPENVKLTFNNVGIAFDNMQFSFAELSLLPLFHPALRLMFSDFCNELEEKARRRQIREEKQRTEELVL